MSLQGAARMLARAGVTGAPVVDAAGRCIGVLSATDFMNWVKADHQAAHAAESMCSAWQIPEAPLDPCSRVEDCMTKDPVLVVPRTKIGELARSMMEAHIHRVIVVDSMSRPLGIVSSTDILAAIARAESSDREANHAASEHVAHALS